MPIESKENLQIARKLMDDFAQRTGLSGKGGNIAERYLWTDAFAVQTFFGLAHACAVDAYHKYALKLIAEVHQTLGRFHPDDIRKGWISGLTEEHGQQHSKRRKCCDDADRVNGREFYRPQMIAVGVLHKI